MIQKIVEVYVDDILEKSKKRSEHIQVLGTIFNTLEEYKVRLNPKNSIFGVTSGKILSLIVSQRGIEINPITKVKAILDMEPPQKLKKL